MCFFVFLHRNFQARCHTGQNKAIFRVHLRTKMYVLVSQVWLSFASCERKRENLKRTPLLLPCPPPPWVTCMFQLDPTQHRVGRHLPRDQLHRASHGLGVTVSGSWHGRGGNRRPGRVGVKERGGRWEARGISTGWSLISHGWLLIGWFWASKQSLLLPPTQKW